MRFSLVDGLPPLSDSPSSPRLRTCCTAAFLRSPDFVARICLESAAVEWLVERSIAEHSETTRRLPRYIDVGGNDLWVDGSLRGVAEIARTECGALLVAARVAATGRSMWEYLIPIPEPAEWAERAPAWPGAQTEEISAFIADDPSRLVVCLFRQSRRLTISSPAEGIDFPELPPYACQLDATCFDARNGNVLWRETYPGVPVGILERYSFTGDWSAGSRVGVIDFENGSNRILNDSSDELGWPVRHGSLVVAPWHSKREIGVEWIDDHGNSSRTAWRRTGVRSTMLHVTPAGLAFQANDQLLWWLGDSDAPIWNIQAKPYIYRVHAAPETDVFIGTDGRGGRLLGFDANSGRETLNLKPALGGVGNLSRIPGHEVLVASFRTSRRYSVSSRLLVLSMRDHTADLTNACDDVINTWEHGAVCRAGRNGDQLAILDVRPVVSERPTERWKK